MKKIIIMFFILTVLAVNSFAQTPYWTGDGGKNIRVTVSEPSGKGLSSQEKSLLPLIQSTIIGAFQRFSAMTVTDQLNLEKTLEQQRLSASGNFSDTDYIRIGNLTHARLVVFGSITKTATGYTLELAVTDVETGERKASYLPKQVSLLALENLSVIREASADLLGQLGVNLTANAIQELKRAENTARVQAENALSRGISAQRQGTTVEALTYYFQAASLDPSLNGAINRALAVSENISSGSLGQDIRNRLQVHDEWRTIVTAARKFYADHLPYELVYNTDDIRRGKIDFEKRTTNLSIDISLTPTDAWKTINNLRQGLTKARQRDETWNFNLNQIEPRSIVVTIEIVNEKNIRLSRATHTFNNPREQTQENATLNFQNVRADDITERLTVRVVSVNEIPAQKAGETGYIRISSLAQIRAAEEAARKEREEIDRLEREAREKERIVREEAARKERIAREEARKQWEAEHPEEAKKQQEEARRKQEEREAAAKKAQEAREAEAETKRKQEASNERRSLGKRTGIEVLPLAIQWDGENISFDFFIFNFYWSPFPYTAIGLEPKIIVYNDPSDPREVEVEDEDGNITTTTNTIHGSFAASAILGVLIPINKWAAVFSDGVLEFGNFGPWNGLITDWMSPGFDIGIKLGTDYIDFNLKYRGTWYKENYTHSIGIGIGWRGGSKT